MSYSNYKLSPAARAHEDGHPAGGEVRATASGPLITGDPQAFEWYAGGGGRAAGVTVTPENAMRVTAVWRCVTLVAGRMMTAPLCVYERTSGAPKKLPDHDLVRFLQVEPSESMSAAEFVELQAMAVLLRGNGYGLIRQARNGVIHDIDYFHPAQVTPYWSGKTAWYRFVNLDGSIEDHDGSQVLHFKGPGRTPDGLRGLSPIQHHAEAVGIAMASRGYTARQFEQGLLTNDYFTAESQMTAEQRADFKDYLRRRQQGLAAAHNPLVLEKGMEWKRLEVSAKDAQLLELLQFSTLDIARLFGVPPHLAGEVTTSTSWGTGIEQQNMGLDSYTLLPHRERMAGELTRKFFPVVGRQLPKYFIDFDPEAQLRGDMKTRGEFSRGALGGNQLPGFMSQNEVRRSFGLPSIEGGDEVYWPAPAPVTSPAGADADPNQQEDGDDAA